MEINLTINPQKDISSEFERIANELLNDWILCVNNSKYRITEIEFYYLDNDSHKDSYTHGHPQQKTNGNWYFHGSGVDLTFGSKDSYGGILIRGIYNLKNPKYINGPLKTVTELFSNLDSIYLKDLKFGLMPDSEQLIAKEKLIKAPRVGLNPDKDAAKFKELYRFLVMPKEDHKDKTIIHKSLIEQGYSKENANVIWK